MGGERVDWLGKLISGTGAIFGRRGKSPLVSIFGISTPSSLPGVLLVVVTAIGRGVVVDAVRGIVPGAPTTGALVAVVTTIGARVGCVTGLGAGVARTPGPTWPFGTI